jgi:hypothetical protein
MHGNEDRHAKPADAMQDERELVIPSPVAQACCQGDVPFQAHLCLLESFFVER